MHTQFQTYQRNLGELCETLECLVQGQVAANVAEISRNPDDFPCCCKCGGLCADPTGSFPVLNPGPYQHDEDERPVPSPVGFRFKTVHELAKLKRGTALDLAIFQCAQEQRRGKECHVGVAADQGGGLHAFVVYADAVRNPAQEQLEKEEGCSCG